ncbi:RNA polymerase subunit sigma [Candidatus Woesearchaeota archaeon]|jgi:DNA-directed RNA polymerase subunit L|nr:RNA polymerase subunit sigma [Candidatus Woesearchaeota archaeon]|tara:strand:+ start:645 stop:917 length:273 start_codon:yes stop_codon:yes gene_type:complete
MEIKILEESKDKLLFDVEGETSTIANALKQELETDSHVKSTGYNVPHPLIETPRILVETDGADPKKVVVEACKRLRKEISKLKDQAKVLK